MRPERWTRIGEIVQSALECAPSNRPEILNAACGNDVELRREVDSLLAQQEDSCFTKSSGFADGVKVLEHKIAAQSEGRTIGPYRIVREIGRGGMGTVYKAVRADDAFE